MPLRISLSINKEQSQAHNHTRERAESIQAVEELESHTKEGDHRSTLSRKDDSVAQDQLLISIHVSLKRGLMIGIVPGRSKDI